MSALSCREVEEQIDLLAADECSSTTRAAVERHLEQCVVCAASYAESRRLLGMLDLHWDAAGPENVRQRIEREARRGARPVVLIFVRQAVSLAALLLMTFGLSLLMPSTPTDEGEPRSHLSAQIVRDETQGAKVEKMMAVRAPGDVWPPETAITVRSGQTGAAFRTALREGRFGEHLPLPPAVPIALELRNEGRRPLLIRLGDASTRLTLDVRGTGVLTVPAIGFHEPAFFRVRTIRLDLGQYEVFHIERLVAGSPGRLEYVYLTEPGDYTLTARLRVTVGGTVTTVTSTPVRVTVVK